MVVTRENRRTWIKPASVPPISNMNSKWTGLESNRGLYDGRPVIKSSAMAQSNVPCGFSQCVDGCEGTVK